jgi:uncharacterized membrane protein YoaK (UPF0700 family)
MPDRPEPPDRPDSDRPDAERPDSGPLSVVLALSAVAGFLDAFNLAGLSGTFVAAQTGNTVLVGIALADADLRELWPPLLVILAFLAGGSLTILVARNRPPPVRRLRLLLLELVLLAAVVVAALATAGLEVERLHGPELFVVVSLASAAMAVQTMVIRHVRGEGVSTTFNSGMLADAGLQLGRIVSTGPTDRRLPWIRASVVGVAVACYAGGAALGALGVKGGTLWLLAPVAVVAAVLAHMVRSDRW